MKRRGKEALEEEVMLNASVFKWCLRDFIKWFLCVLTEFFLQWLCLGFRGQNEEVFSKGNLLHL